MTETITLSDKELNFREIANNEIWTGPDTLYPNEN
jgi:hypothetical protein